jgi:isopenicillin-N N-acyltransferase-like protein
MQSAVAVATRDRVCAPAHFLIASAEGQAAGLEVHPGEPGRLASERGVLTHTNHLYARGEACQVEDFPRPDSRPRLARLDQLLRERLPADAEVEEARLFDILSDHQGAPLSICRHHNPDQPPEERMETLFSVVMNLEARRLTLRHGKPCESHDTLSLSVEN